VLLLSMLNSVGKSRAHQKAQSKPTNEGYNLIECFVHGLNERLGLKENGSTCDGFDPRAPINQTDSQ